jgi:proteasome accessory factor B
VVTGVENQRVLHPYTLATFRQGLYLFALDTEANQVKTFAVERFVDVMRRRNEHFQVPAGWRPEAHLAHAFGIISGAPEDVAVAFAERRTAFVRERTWHPTQTFRTLPDGRLELRMSVAATVELEAWVLGFGSDAEVLSPPSLRRTVAASLRAAAARYGSAE